MKRTNLVLDELLLKKTLAFSQKKTYSDAVMEAMKEYIRVKEFLKVLDFGSTGIWEGDLSAMRNDSYLKILTKKKRKTTKHVSR